MLAKHLNHRNKSMPTCF